MEKEPNDIEKLKQEFEAKVDAGEFDDIIQARAIHSDDQYDESVRRRENPTTPDELIKSATFDYEFEREMRELEKEDDINDERIKSMADRLRERALKIPEIDREQGRKGVNKYMFKTNPQNLQDYLDGKLRSK